MKKVLIAYGVLVVVVLILAFAKFNGQNFLPNFNMIGGSDPTVTINDQTYAVELADDDTERQVGLSGRESLDEEKGMLFVFEEKGKYNFWMKDTLIPLDIIYINDDTIVHVVKNAQPDNGEGPVQETNPTVDANYVLELNAGEAEEHDFKNGDKVSFSGVN